MVYITGDTHGEFERFSSKSFPDQKEMTKDDIVIICGDFGGVWEDTPAERYWLNWLNNKPFTVCFVDGNHENYDRLYNDFDVIDFHGGKVHRIRNSVFHLMRGYVFDFEGKKFFCMGGAQSQDIYGGILEKDDPNFKKKYNQLIKQRVAFRINHVSWWKEELPSQEEMDFGIENLKKVDMKVDYIITHCFPQNIAGAAGYFGRDNLITYFDELIYSGLNFTDWYCGHYHEDRTIMRKFNVRYKKIERIL